MKIVVLGPFYPYKGGIMHFTTQTSKALSKRHDVINVSYSLQYPKILFPRGEQRDFSNTQSKLDNINYWLNTANPFSCIAVAKKINRLKPDLIIFNWFHTYFAPSLWIICKLLNKKIKILFLCHNVLPHEKIPFQKSMTKAVLKNANFSIVMAKSEEQALKTLIKNPVIKRTLHPLYDMFCNPAEFTKQSARESLGIFDNDFVMLFFGYIREYKGLKIFLEAYQKIVKNVNNTTLLIGGEFNKSEKDEYVNLIEKAGKNGGKIMISGDYLSESDVNKYFTASDVVVLPYLSATQSGVATIAYAYGKPVIATTVGGLPEVVTEGETGYLAPPGDSEALANVVINFAKIHDKTVFSERISRELQKFSWDRLVEAVEELMKII